MTPRSIQVVGLTVARKLFTLCSLLMIASCGYADESKEPPHLSVQSKNSLEFLALCVTQDWDDAFPRLFSTTSSRGKKSFGTYDGIQITIRDLGSIRRIEARTPKSLSGEMIAYLRKCGSDVWWDGSASEKQN